MTRKITFNCLLAFSISIILLLACAPAQGNHITQTAESPTLLPTSASLPAVLAATLVSDPEYMKECKIINPDNRQNQIGYLGIFPGQSTDENVKALLGSPKEQNPIKKIEEWVYIGFNIYIQRRVVTSIDVYEDAQIMVNLKELTVEYGCADLIFAIDTSIEQPEGNYSLATFINLNNGIEFIFPDFPVSLSDIPTSITFFKPQSLESYLEQSNYINYSLENGKPVSWSEAVK